MPDQAIPTRHYEGMHACITAIKGLMFSQRFIKIQLKKQKKARRAFLRNFTHNRLLSDLVNLVTELRVECGDWIWKRSRFSKCSFVISSGCNNWSKYPKLNFLKTGLGLRLQRPVVISFWMKYSLRSWRYCPNRSISFNYSVRRSRLLRLVMTFYYYNYEYYIKS